MNAWERFGRIACGLLIIAASIFILWAGTVAVPGRQAHLVASNAVIVTIMLLFIVGFVAGLVIVIDGIIS